MFTRASKYYWWCQVLGWSFLGLLNIVLAYSFRQLDWKFVSERILFSVSGLVITHLFRTFMIAYNWLQYALDKLIWRLLLGIAFCSLAITFLSDFYNYIFHFYGGRESRQSQLIGLFFGAFFFVLIWTLIYILWHYFQKDQRYKMDQLKLEAVVKELELKTIKAQLNPHFIFNALNSIRALIDENPSRARRAITELSNILRNSMQAEKVETVSLENEINIVKDYLALENIRYEERLQVNYNIDSDTLELPVPPLMLQTLVENAIKHGISKEIKGGVVNIISKIKGMFHEIIIQNTGTIPDKRNDDGFGLQSTRQRLEILFGNTASLAINNVGDNMVEAKITMPLI